MVLRVREFEEIKRSGCSALFNCRFLQKLVAKDIYFPTLDPSIKDFTKFLYTVGLFAIMGVFVSSIINVFYKIWEIENDIDGQLVVLKDARKDTIKCLNELDTIYGDTEDYRNEIEKIKSNKRDKLLEKIKTLEEKIEDTHGNIIDTKINFLNPSKTNNLFYKPVFFPFVGGILAIFFVFLLCGFGSSLIRIGIVSTLVGVGFGLSPIQIVNKVREVIKTVL